MYLAGRNQPLGELGLGKGLEVLAEAGAVGVELCHEHPALAPGRMSEEFAAEVAQMVQAAGLKVSACGWHCDYVSSDLNFAALPELIARAPLLGTDTFILAGATTDDPNLWRAMVERTGHLCEAAERAGVRLAIEYEPGFLVRDARALRRLFREVDSPVLGANLDLGHAFLCEKNPLKAIRHLGERILHCHVENMAEGVHRHLPPWEGDMDLKAYLGTLQEVGYDGALALDLYEEDYARVAPRCFGHLQRLLEELSPKS